MQEVVFTLPLKEEEQLSKTIFIARGEENFFFSHPHR